MMPLLRRSLLRSVASVGLVFALFASAVGCAAPPEDGEGNAGAIESNVTSGLEARRELSYACPTSDDGIKVAFFDADSTLRVAKSDAVTANAVDDVDLLPFAAKAIREKNAEGFLVAIVSNQGGISAGKTTYEVAEGALLTTIRKLEKLGARVNYLDFAEADDENRKPAIGMATRLDEMLKASCGRGIDLARSTMTGDSGYKKDKDGPHPDGRPADDFSNSDRLFAENLGIPFEEPTDAFGWRDFGVFNVMGETELLVVLEKMSARAEELRAAGDAEAADALDAEVASNRDVNGLR